jgi:hypothetical protein
MPKGLSLHIGVNEVDPGHYAGWNGRLNACEADADVHMALAQAAGFDASMLKTNYATREAVIRAVFSAAETLSGGDIFLLTYAGHGGQVTDYTGDEEDGIDETWLLYDGQLLDDELSVLWSQFAAGVRILVLSDSCHSGTVAKSASFRRSAMAQRNAFFAQEAPVSDETPRFMPRDKAVATMRKNRDFYQAIQLELPSPRPEIQASVRLISGCQDEQCSWEKDGNGVFTRTLRGVWDDGAFGGDYGQFHLAILAKMKKKQQPNHIVLGQLLAEFDRQKPFSIS